MKVTFIMRDFTEQFYNGFGANIPSFNAMNEADKFETCRKLSASGRVPIKIGTGQFRDRVELNSMLRNACAFDFKIEPRRGYKLATFDVNPLTSR